MAEVPGGVSGLLCRDYKGKEADRLVTRIDSGVVSLVAELRGRERHAEELEQWSEKREVPGDAAPQTAITVRFVRPGEALPSSDL